MFFFTRTAAVPQHVPAPDQDRDLVLFKYDACGYCQRVMAVLRDLELSVELRDTLLERAHRAELAERTGRTQVPCLFVDGEPLFESADIVAWLDAYAKRAAA